MNTRRNEILYILGLGSNLPIPEKNLIKAIFHLNKQKNIKIINYSSFYISEPAGYKDQPVFINCAVLIETKIPPLKLLKKIKKIESELGRIKSFKNSPRVIDIDILLCSNLVVNYKKLKIPHKNFLKRAFDFFPCLEIAPFFTHPLIKKKLSEINLNLKNYALKSIKPEIKLI